MGKAQKLSIRVVHVLNQTKKKGLITVCVSLLINHYRELNNIAFFLLIDTVDEKWCL